MRMRIGSITLIAVAVTCSASAATPDGLEITPISVKAKKVQQGKWLRASDALSKPTMRLAVVATWCHYSDSLVRGLAKRPDLSRTLDAIVILENDLDTALEQYVAAGEIPRKDLARFRARFLKANGANIFDVKFVNPLAGRFFVARTNGALSKVTGFPSYLNCDDRSCTQMSAGEWAPFQKIMMVEERAKESQVGARR